MLHMYLLLMPLPLLKCMCVACSAVFTLHGLWPERQKPIDGKMWPECCNPSLTFDEAELKVGLPGCLTLHHIT